jgi:hypothetical protein
MFNRRNARHASGAVKRSPYLVPMAVMLSVLASAGSVMAFTMAPHTASTLPNPPRACSHPLLPSGDAKRNAGGAVYICVDGTYVNAVNFTNEP